MGRFVQKSLHAAASGYEKEKIYIMCYQHLLLFFYGFIIEKKCGECVTAF